MRRCLLAVLLAASSGNGLASAQDLQADYARDALAAVAAGDDELLCAMARELPYRARPLVHELLWEALRAGAGDERALASARRIAAACEASRSADDLAKAVRAVEELGERARAARRDLDQALSRASEAAGRGDWSAAEEHARTAVERALDTGLPYLELRARRLQADVSLRQGRRQDFRARMLIVVELERALDLPLDGKLDLEALAQAEWQEGALHNALEHFEEAERLARRTEDPERALSALAQRGGVLSNLGRSSEAHETLTGVLAALGGRGRPAQTAYVLSLLGSLESGSGCYGEALTRLSESLRAWGEAGNPAGEAHAAIQLAGLYSELGLAREAEEALGTASALIEAHGLGQERFPALLVRALMQLDDGRPGEALSTLDGALTAAGLDFERAEAARLRGTACLALGREREAEEAFRSSLALWSADPLATTWCRTALGDALLLQGRVDESEREYGRALEGAGVSSLEGTWRALFGLGRAAEASDRPAEALARYLRAIEDVEAIRSVLGAPALRLRWLGNKLELYRRAARLLARSDRLEEAFRTAEAAKARTLLELTSARPPARAAPDPHSAGEPTAGARLAAAHARLSASESLLHLLEQELAALRSTAASAPLLDAAVRSELEGRLQHERAEHEAARIELQLADPRGAVLLGLADAPSLEETRAALREEELLLHYLVGPEGASVFAVHAGGARFVELAATEEELARRIERILRPIELLRRERLDLATLGFDARAARELFELLLGPVQGELEGHRTLWIVPDGPLRRLPFALLLSGREKRPVDPENLFAQYRGCRFLIEDCAVAQLPTAGLLGTRAAPNPAGDPDLLVVADPRPPPPGALALGCSGEEAQAVAAAHAGESVCLLLGEEAGEARVKALVSTARVVHFITHGILDDRRPAYSRLALAADAREDGWLFAYEVEELSLAAERVVLSACETLGEAGRGEGLLGLSRAFLQAGARSVVATAWAVDDQATAELMRRYEGALASGQAPVAALRTAQVGLLREGGRPGVPYVHPYFWGGFLHVGQR